MSLFEKIFGEKYDDMQIVREAEQVLANDPVLNAGAAIDMSSEEGELVLRGQVNSEREKRHVEDLVRTAMDSSAVNIRSIDNRLHTN